jgi:hypothetical protein
VYYPLILLATIVVYTFALKWAYENIVSPTFSYLGEEYRPPDTTNYIVSLALLYLIGLFLPYLVQNAARFMTWVMYLLMIVPLMAVPHYTALCSPEQAMKIAIISGASFCFILLLIRVLPTDIAPTIPLPADAFWMGITLFSFGTYAYIAVTTGFQAASLDLTQVYGIRDSYRDTIASGGPVLGYLVRFQGNVINPLLITRGATGGRKWLIVAGLFGQFVLFSITGYKMTLLSGVGILLVILGLKVFKQLRGFAIGVACTAMVCLAVTIDGFRGTTTWTAIFVDRFMLVSGNLPSAYFAVFEGLPPILWRDSFLSFLGSSPYSTNAGFIVGQYMTGNPKVQANSNYVADGFANMHTPGIFIEAFVCAVVIAFASSAGRKLPLPVTAGVLFTPVIALVNSSPITAIISNGFLLASLIFIFAPASLWSATDQAEHAEKRRMRAERRQAKRVRRTRGRAVTPSPGPRPTQRRLAATRR